MDPRVSWIFAKQQKNPHPKANIDKIGKWMLFIPENEIHEIWNKVCDGVKSKNLWEAKVCPKVHLKKNEYAIMIYTPDYKDLDDVKRTLKYITKNILNLKKTIYYKTDDQTRRHIYSGDKERSWIYSSSQFEIDDLF